MIIEILIYIFFRWQWERENYAYS